jgi:hypothetical protein
MAHDTNRQSTSRVAQRRRQKRLRRRHGLRNVGIIVVVAAIASAIYVSRHDEPTALSSASTYESAAVAAQENVSAAFAVSALRGRIVQIAENQVGYTTNPSNTYCNKYSAYWVSGTADCGNSNLDEEWCADFAAWVWKSAGATVVYQYINGDLNSSSASFYEWGVANGTWHPASSDYVPQPGDVAVYGLDAATLVAQHVAVVVGYTPGSRGPNVVNGDGDKGGFSLVEARNEQYKADAPGVTAYLSGYVSPS